MKLTVLGPRCPRSRRLAATVERMAREMELNAAIEWISDDADMKRLGGESVPALLVDGEVRASGCTLGAADVRRVLMEVCYPEGIATA